MASDDISVASSSRASSSFSLYYPQGAPWNQQHLHCDHCHHFEQYGASVVSEERWNGGTNARKRGCFWCWLTLLTSISITVCTVFAVWLVRRPYSPHLALGGAKFSRMSLVNPLNNEVHSDDTPSPTLFLEMDSLVYINFYNPSSNFEMHYSPMTFTLLYLEVPLARSKLAGFTQERESKRVVHLRFKSAKVPLEGVGPRLQGSLKDTTPLPLSLHATVDAWTNVWGKLVTRRYHQNLTCRLLLDAGVLELTTSSCSSSTI